MDHRRRQAALSVLLLCVSVRAAAAQDEVRNFRKPVLIVETEGHHAPVRSLVWENSFTLLSGGMDKVVKVWDLAAGARLVRSIRPPIWRGPAGQIYAMALSPRPDARGERYLAVAGYGVESTRGDITIFRYPGLERASTGEPAERLLSRRTGNLAALGHTDSVSCMAFSPDGHTLATADANGLGILWDVPAFRHRASLRGHRGPVRALAFLPDSRRLATAGADGSVRIWDTTHGAQLDIRQGNPQQPVVISALAISPDGQAIVIGRENGDVYRFDSRSLTRIPAVPLRTHSNKGSIEALTFHPKGRWLAASIKTDNADTLNPITLACDLEIWEMPSGKVIHQRRIPGLVYACAFRPDGNALAYAGGTAESIYIQDMNNLQAPLKRLEGKGTRVFDIGFKTDNQVIGFTRQPFAPANPPSVYEAFDLAKNEYGSVFRKDLHRAITEYDGWTVIGSLQQYRLELVHTAGRRWRLDLDPDVDRYWWSYTFVPPGPGHARPTVAIGCESGILLYDLATGQRARMFTGHSGPVISLAPSPDGRWLASSALDQTILVYPLDGCDTRPGLGATFEQRAGGSWVVSKVVPRGFAEAMGLLPGDVVLKAGIANRTSGRWYQTAAQLADFARDADSARPNDTIGIYVRRFMNIPSIGTIAIDMAPMPSTKRDNAIESLLVGVDKEWVAWTPRGYYDTSIEGDSRFLGWQTNPPYDAALPTDYVPVATYAATMYRPELLKGLWQRAQVDQGAAAEAGRSKQEPGGMDPPPEVRFAAVAADPPLPPVGMTWKVAVPNPKVQVRITSKGKSKIREREVYLDERRLPRPPLVEPVADLREEVQLPELVPARTARITVRAFDQSRNPRVEALDVLYAPPAPPPSVAPPPRVMILGIGSVRFQNPGLPEIRFADNDVESLAAFLRKHLLPPSAGKPTPAGANDQVVLVGNSASHQSIIATFDKLRSALETKQLRPGDLVALVIATHMLEFDGRIVLASADTAGGHTPSPTIAASDVAERLGELTDYGCRVVVFLDGVHKLPAGALTSSVKPWVRDLQLNRRVITFIAAKQGAGGLDQTRQHSIFALGLLDAFQAAGATAARQYRSDAYSLEDFRIAVRDEMLNLSGRHQDLGCFIPIAIPQESPFAVP